MQFRGWCDAFFAALSSFSSLSRHLGVVGRTAAMLDTFTLSDLPFPVK